MTVFVVLAFVACALTGCGAERPPSGEEREVRALFAAVAADGRAHRFARICDEEMTGWLRELDYLIGVNCAKGLEAEWAEGVQLERIGPSTRIVVAGDSATVFDGPVPDRAERVDDVWRVAELPRNRRLSEVDEARKTADQVNALLRAHHLPPISSPRTRL